MRHVEGALMSPTITIALSDVWAAISVLAMLLGVWWRLQAQLNEHARKLDRKVCRRELDELRVEIVRDYVSKGMLEKELHYIRDELHELKEMLMKLIQERADAKQD